MQRNCSPHPAQHGFTLVELVMVIVILGVIGTTIAVFMRNPIDAYLATSRRAALADEADTVVRRMARDLRTALPNSIRQASNQCIEFIPTRIGARYRAIDKVAGDGSGLDFTSADTTFNMLGDNTALNTRQQIRVNDIVAIYNLGIPDSTAYSGNNTSVVTAIGTVSGGETPITINSKLFPQESGSKRFHVIPSDDTVASYICSGGNLYRNANYALSTSCPTPAAGTPLIAKGATCNFSYTVVDQRNALVQLNLTFTDSGESVNVYHEVHTNNTP